MPNGQGVTLHKRTTPKIFGRAKQLHRKMTLVEAKLWSHLRAHRMGNVHFRNQHAIGNYIVDFCAPRKKLIIEPDGSQHLEQEEYDEERSAFLKFKGYHVLRFWNNDVLNNTDSVLTMIWDSKNRTYWTHPSSPFQVTRANTEMAKISARAHMITRIATSLVAIIGFIWGSLFLQKQTSAPTPTIESHRWYVIFELKLPANYWAEGVHSFLFDANCPLDINATNENGPTNSFSVDRTAQIQNSTVFIRRRGLYLTEIEGDAFGHLIHPSQETAAIYSLFAISLEGAKRLQAECKVLIKIDNQ